ncbi:serine/threonine-protein kinase [Nonomuraea sp. NPDC049421]|uniref:serine/threonine-protein kinase n=1 Tax=Nonomuraea sp. NPDC049421 TaxID=3155275 RepID=UPI00343BDCE0
MQDLPVPSRGDPAHIGGHRVLGRLGEGGQGTVFLGASPAGRRVAIKVLHPCFAADRPMRRRFRREADIVRGLAGFATARVLETGFTGERPYIVSEYVPGPSLERLVKEDGPRGGSALERLAVTTLTALASIHAAGIVHRDIKPSNVIMGSEGPVLIDFGIASPLDAAARSATPIGTPAYMSPEQFDDLPPTAASDLFSWAGTMIYAATGRPAFAGGSVPATLNAVLHAEPDLSGLPEPLRGVVAACLAKDPAARPAAAQVLCELAGHKPAPALSQQAPSRQAPSQQALSQQALSQQALPQQALSQQAPCHQARHRRPHRPHRRRGLAVVAACAAVLAGRAGRIGSVS